MQGTMGAPSRVGKRADEGIRPYGCGEKRAAQWTAPAGSVCGTHKRVPYEMDYAFSSSLAFRSA